MVFDAHNRAFAWYGGNCERGIYDNMRTAVSQVKSGKERHYNRRFEQMCSHFLVRPQACTPAAGWEKGRVEKQVMDLRRALLSGGELQFDSLDELNEHLQAGFVRYSHNTRHPEFRHKSVHQVFLEERFESDSVCRGFRCLERTHGDGDQDSIGEFRQEPLQCGGPGQEPRRGAASLQRSGGHSAGRRGRGRT